MNYLSPGVYVSEEETGSRPIEAVGTSTAGFVGIAPDAAAGAGRAVAVNSWLEFRRDYVREGAASTDLTQAVFGFFANGGARCYVVNVGPGAAIQAGLDLLGQIDEIAAIAAPGRTDLASHRALLDAAEAALDRVAILDGPARIGDVEPLTRVAVDGPADADAGPAGGGPVAPGLRPPVSDRGYGAFYFPWLRATDALDPTKTVDAAPSGYLAGLFARTDTERGVHKAPANMPIRGAVGVTRFVSRAEQETLNPMGVNCIRYFSREGVRVWGARTLAPSASNWRYLNVRRLFNMIEESIALATRWVVFEPNDRLLWKQIERDVGAFLMMLWSQGALSGATPEQAFFVRCDETTNTSDLIEAGQVVTLIGLAPSRPAEFVIFRIGQSAAGPTVEAA